MRISPLSGRHARQDAGRGSGGLPLKKKRRKKGGVIPEKLRSADLAERSNFDLSSSLRPGYAGTARGRLF